MAVVTGANRGVGQAIATILADSGYTVVAMSRQPCPDSRVRHVECHLDDHDSVEKACSALLEEFDRIDAVVANSAVRSLGQVADLPPQDWREAVEVNLCSTFTLIQRTLPLLRCCAGRIAVIGSHAATYFFEGGAAYCTTKAALKALVEVLLLEERPRGVRTTLLNPGGIANLPEDNSTTKLTTQSVAEAVLWVLQSPPDLVVGELEIRPSRLPNMPVTGFDRLKAV
ncbi:SDR family oxidoreductase [Allosaccharopolyspora coralli]|uniref:SDR family oxidoreductase n=1 Tax=Allosaccharopolyspora coralli TaxID=2665642 RepID=UPI001651DE2E|nr:SDR family NAD(P)-dependent oxidoreductase [Allosaccharopolyspora coralli]